MTIEMTSMTTSTTTGATTGATTDTAAAKTGKRAKQLGRPASAVPVVSIVGATGLVGTEIARILELRGFPARRLVLYSSGRKPERKLLVSGVDQPVHPFTMDAFRRLSGGGGRGVCFLAAGGEFSREYARRIAGAGHVVIDNSSAFRMDPTVPLVVPEVNPQDLARHDGLVANPNCSTIQMVVALGPLHRVWTLRKVVVATYQAVAGAGLAATGELAAQSLAVLEGRPVRPLALPHRIAFNLIPRIDVLDGEGWTGEERKLMNETRKILGDQSIQVVATAVRVPVFRGHSEAVWAEFAGAVGVAEARRILRQAPGVTLVDDPDHDLYPMPADCAGKADTFVGRLRRDPDSARALLLWVVSDNVWKGAALNAVQIAEELI
jgi:aspartate-semialdehyde dehydrogenase